jgi:sphingolipid delta-4 desaturase
MLHSVTNTRNDFHQSADEQPHRERTRTILAAHPEIRGLVGENPWTFALIVGVVALQTGHAALMGRLGLGGWWVALIVAWCVGAFANHALYVMIHDATHNLIFRRRAPNQWAAILADLPNVFPAAMGFRVYHLQHHAHQGDYHLDADIANRWEARLVGHSPLGKTLWLLCFPLFQLTRPPRLRAIRLWSAWNWANLTVNATFVALVYAFFGANAIIYLTASFFFSVGLHPLGARWIQEHYTLDPSQETFSYYGPLNALALNVGYHNEHHDFPSVAWNRLPQIRAAAPEFYNALQSHDSWVKLWLQFIFDPRYDLFGRVERRADQSTSAT